MNSPIKSGDECVVIAGLGQHKSPNLGLKVKVTTLRGEHSRFGRVWRCEGAGVKQLADNGDYAELGWADFPAVWLQKIPPVTTKTEENKHVEVPTST